MLLDVLPVVGDAGGRDDRISQDLEADLAAQVVWDVPLLWVEYTEHVTSRLYSGSDVTAATLVSGRFFYSMGAFINHTFIHQFIEVAEINVHSYGK